MKHTKLSIIALAIAPFFATQAMAIDNGPATRAQVQIELAEAIQAGDMIVGESGVRMNEIYPHNYPQKAQSTVTRAEVQAELAQAIRAGEINHGQTSKTLNEINPYNYPAQNTIASKTREQVQTELAEAAANGWLDRHIPA